MDDGEGRLWMTSGDVWRQRRTTMTDDDDEKADLYSAIQFTP